jgi:hypothetical protein
MNLKIINLISNKLMSITIDELEKWILNKNINPKTGKKNN